MTGLKASTLFRAYKGIEAEICLYCSWEESVPNKLYRQRGYFTKKLLDKLEAQEKELDELRSMV